jgi:peptide-methionine (S)-S-oxide reductase
VASDAEALQVTFDPSIVSYRSLLEFFFRMHDPTTKNMQGPDIGTQYRSAIFTHGEEQQKIAEDVAEKVSKEWYHKPLSTEIVPAGQWWDAEEYHQLYLNKNPAGYECPAQYVSFDGVFVEVVGWVVLTCYEQLCETVSAAFGLTRSEDIKYGMWLIMVNISEWVRGSFDVACCVVVYVGITC